LANTRFLEREEVVVGNKRSLMVQVVGDEKQMLEKEGRGEKGARFFFIHLESGS